MYDVPRVTSRSILSHKSLVPASIKVEAHLNDNLFVKQICKSSCNNGNFSYAFATVFVSVVHCVQRGD